MSDLLYGVCLPCEEGGDPMKIEVAENYRKKVPEWKISNSDGVLKLEKRFDFKNFKDALSFTINVGEEAEKNAHHPVITLEWGKVTILWWTHAISGLHVNDFIMAAKTDSLFKK